MPKSSQFSPRERTLVRERPAWTINPPGAPLRLRSGQAIKRSLSGIDPHDLLLLTRPGSRKGRSKSEFFCDLAEPPVSRPNRKRLVKQGGGDQMKVSHPNSFIEQFAKFEQAK